MEIRKVNYNGSSYILTIPPSYAKALQLTSAAQVTLELNKEKQLIVTPLLRRLKGSED